MRLARAAAICILALHGVLQGAAMAAFHCRSPFDAGATTLCRESGADAGSGNEDASVDVCLFCSGQAQGYRRPSAPRFESILAPRARSSAPKGQKVATLASSPIGWASAWSSRAPPLVS
jgi:hypothetical protein